MAPRDNLNCWAMATLEELKVFVVKLVVWEKKIEKKIIVCKKKDVLLFVLVNSSLEGDVTAG